MNEQRTGLQNGRRVLAKTPKAGTAQDAENIGTASPARTGDPQIHKLRRGAQVADIPQELLYNIAQIFPISSAICTTSRYVYRSASPLIPMAARYS
jgi:hypothetical protein